jgi:alpha-tubulin suppressor-like RCC1 family protein
MTVLAALVAAPSAFPEQAGSREHRLVTGFVAAGGVHTCVILAGGGVRCWGANDSGQLGYGNTDKIGDDEAPGTVGPVALGTGRTARAIAAGADHTCVILDTGRVRCWGWALHGQLGYGDQVDVGDTEMPSAAGPVQLGAGRTAKGITAGAYHTCALLDNGSVRCWGNGTSGQLGNVAAVYIGDDETPDTAGPVDLGAGRKAVAVAAGSYHTCAVLDNGAVRCWGWGLYGQLGYGGTANIGDDETPGSVGPVALGAGRKAIAIAAGEYHTCAILDDGAVRCWGAGDSGELGYGNVDAVGDDETPDAVGPVDLGTGRTAVGIALGLRTSCAVLDTGDVRCWGSSTYGLGYGDREDIGDDETPGSVDPIDLGAGRTALAISGRTGHNCAVLDDGSVRCWGYGLHGQLGYVGTYDVGENETPGSVDPMNAGGVVARRVLPAFTLGLRPGRDRRAPFTFRAAGTLRGFVADAVTCSGTVVVTARKGAQKVVRRPLARPSLGTCGYSAAFRVGGLGIWRVTAKFAGNDSLRAPSARVKSFRAG